MILFVGDCPSPKMKPGAPAFKGAACAARLKSWIEKLAKNQSYILMNQSDEIFVITLYLAKMTGVKIVALGNNASRAINTSHFKLPHPSGRNRQLNDKQFINKKLKECKAFISK